MTQTENKSLIDILNECPRNVFVREADGRYTIPEWPEPDQSGTYVEIGRLEEAMREINKRYLLADVLASDCLIHLNAINGVIRPLRSLADKYNCPELGAMASSLEKVLSVGIKSMQPHAGKSFARVAQTLIASFMAYFKEGVEGQLQGHQMQAQGYVHIEAVLERVRGIVSVVEAASESFARNMASGAYDYDVRL